MSGWRRFLGAKQQTPADLITGSAAPVKTGGWRVSWAGDGDLPGTVQAPSLTEAADEAAAAVATLYGQYPPVPGAEFQLAVFPWRYRGGPMFDISGHSGAFTARELDGERVLTGATLEDLVEAVRSIEDVPEEHSMFRWIREVQSLSIPG
jgi:hypothetical protein